MKGILLAGGKGSRLFPLTKALSKHLLPVYDKPMIFYSLSTLMISKIREILLVSDPVSLPIYKELLGNGKDFGVEINYLSQNKPEGLAHVFRISKKFIGNDSVSLMLGDNFLFGAGLSDLLNNSIKSQSSARIFGYRVSDPSKFGIAKLDKSNKLISIKEKPKRTQSNWAVIGLYFYDNTVIDASFQLKKSTRGEYEITDLNNYYLSQKKLSITLLGRGMSWLDMGTPSSLLKAGQFVETLQKRQGSLIGSPEEIAFQNKWISVEDIFRNLDKKPQSEYICNLKNYLVNHHE